jgi:tetratricopeptide (TPR) repeat protein
VHFRAQRIDTAIAWSDRALRVAEPLDLDEVIGMALTTKGTALGSARRLREGVALLEGALLDARSHGQHLAALRAANNLSSYLVYSDPRASLERAREALELAHLLGYRSFDGYLASNASGAATQTGDWDLVIGWIAEMLEDSWDGTDAPWLKTCLDLATPWRGGADMDFLEAQLAAARGSDDPQSQANILGRLMDIALAAGRLDDAARLAEELLDLDLGWAVAHQCAQVGVHARRPDLVRRAIEASGTGRGRLVDHAVNVSRAGLLAMGGRRAEAVALYRSALDGFRDFGVRFSLAQAIFDMLLVLGPEEPAVRSVLGEGRAILEELRATILLERFDTLVANGTPGAAGVPGPARG